MERPTCGTCPYWLEKNGRCIKHAPRPMWIELLPRNDWNSHEVVWPITEENEGCGEHPDFPAYIASLKEDKDAHDPRKTVKQRFEPPMRRQP